MCEERVRVFGGLPGGAPGAREWLCVASGHMGPRLNLKKDSVLPVWKINSQELSVTTMMIILAVTQVGRWLKYQVRIAGKSGHSVGFAVRAGQGLEAQVQLQKIKGV